MRGWVAKNSLDELWCVCWFFFFLPHWWLTSVQSTAWSRCPTLNLTKPYIRKWSNFCYSSFIYGNVTLTSLSSQCPSCHFNDQHLIFFFFHLPRWDANMNKISWVLDAHVWMFICWLCGNPEIDWLTCFELSAGLGKNGYSSRLQCLKVLEWLKP